VLGRSGRLSRAPGTAVFLTANPDVAPSALLHNLKHNHVLHEHNVVLTMLADPAPYAADARRIELFIHRVEQISRAGAAVALLAALLHRTNVPPESLRRA